MCSQYGHLSARCNGKETCLACGGNHPTVKGQKCSKEARHINCGGNHTAFSKEWGKRAAEEKVNKLMVSNITSAKEARKIVNTMDHRPPMSPQFKPMENFLLLGNGQSDLILSEKTHTLFENQR
jgi:hypothetical protein